MKTITPGLAVCIIAVGVAVVAAVVVPGAESGRAAVGDTASTVAIEDFAYSATPVPAGAMVRVTNVDASSHTLTADDGAFDSGVVTTGADGTFTAPGQPGEYGIVCTIHPFMSGTLVVASA
ncbi:MAG: cupredoxin domain-containing protein [Acidimicrobiia bacterium]